MREYDLIADWFVAARGPTIGRPEIVALADLLTPHADVLDLGCGAGVPITEELIRRGLCVYGVDSSAKLLDRFRARFPSVPVECATLQASTFFGIQFDAAVAWGVLFHLSADDQALIIDKVARSLRPGGHFIFTSGDVAGVREGTMGGEIFSYLSLGSTRYVELLDRAGLRLREEYDDAGQNHVYWATKPR